MCSVTAGFMAASMAMSAYSAYKGQGAQNKAAEYNAQIMDRNAKIADMNVKDAEYRGKLEEKQHRLKVSQMKGSQRSSFGASGVVVDSGSAFDVLEDTAKFGELDALTIRRNSAKEALGYKYQGANYIAQGNLSRASIRSPFQAAGMSLLSSGSSYGSMYAMNRS